MAEGAWFVLHKDIENNRLVIGQGHEHPLMQSTTLWSETIDWGAGEMQIPETGFRCTSRTRYRQDDQDCVIFNDPTTPGGVRVEFDEPQRAVTPGQSVVFYSGEVCFVPIREQLALPAECGGHRLPVQIQVQVAPRLRCNDYIHVDILSDISGTSFLYSGKLFHYCLGKDGGLESIIMIHPFRIKRENFDEGRTSGQFMMPITVDYMVFLHEHIINYNFTYLSLKKPRNRIMLLLKRLYRYFVHPAIACVLLLLIWHKHDWFIEQIHLGLLRLL